MFSFFKNTAHVVELPAQTIPLTDIQEIDEAGILFLDVEGNSTNISYYEAYKGWCKSKNLKKSKPKYICDRIKGDVWKLVFYTNPQITFFTDPSNEELWIDILNQMTLQGFPSFDQN